MPSSSGGLGRAGLTGQLVEMPVNAQEVTLGHNGATLAVGRLQRSPAGILHCVDGSLALLLPPLHVSLWATGGLLAVGAAVSILPAL